MNSKHAEQFLQCINDVKSYFSNTEKSSTSIKIKSIQKAVNLNTPTAVFNSLSEISDTVSYCSLCALSENRKKPVPGIGVQNPKVLIIGDAPSIGDDTSGLPFSGKIGEYLDKWLEAIHLSKDKDLFLTNIVKCRPADNKTPEPEECRICSSFLKNQISILKPKIILALGSTAAQFLTRSSLGIDKLRGKIYQFKDYPLVVTYHPAVVLENQDYRKAVWQDLKLLKDNL